MKNQNVNIKETIKLGGNDTRQEKVFATNLMIAKLLIDKPKSAALTILFGIFNAFTLIYSMLFLGGFMIFLSLIINMVRADIGINMPYMQYFIAAFVLCSIIVLIPTKIIQKIVISKAKKNFEENNE